MCVKYTDKPFQVYKSVVLIVHFLICVESVTQTIPSVTYTSDKHIIPAVLNKDKYSSQCVPIQQFNWSNRKRILVTGGAGFVGSHLVDRLMKDGHKVVVIDNFLTGNYKNIKHWIGHCNFEFINRDIIHPLYIKVDEIYHLASAASPKYYTQHPIKTIKANTLGTLHMLELAHRTNSKFLFASTSEVYGDPEIHPQLETYWGNVNPIGPRACYDESKRLGETLTYVYSTHLNLPVRVARIFNTYGPRMQIDDGRVVTNFIIQAMENKPITVYGSGEQTRSFQYITDLIDGLLCLMQSNYTLPVNIGNPTELTINRLAQVVKSAVGSNSTIIYKPAPVDDPKRRQPDITVARTHLHWKPKVHFTEGLQYTLNYFRDSK